MALRCCEQGFVGQVEYRWLMSVLACPRALLTTDIISGQSRGPL